MTVDDAALVRKCLRRDPDAIRALVERYQADVFGVCVRLLSHRQDAEDVSQEVFLRVFRSLGRWDPQRPLRPWILGITVNRCRTWMARRRNHPETVDYLHEVLASKPADDVDELVVELRSAVDRLRPEYRTAFVLFHERNVPYEEIAEVLGRPVGTIKTWLHRARAEILERLRQRGMVQAEMPRPLPASDNAEVRQR